MSGYTTIEHLDFLAHAKNLPERFSTLVFLVGINDFLKALNGSLERGPRPLWRRSSFAHLMFSLNRVRLATRAISDAEDEHGANLAARQRARSAAPRVLHLPDLREQISEYVSRVETMARLCKRYEVRCIFLTQPTTWGASPDSGIEPRLWMGADSNGAYFERISLQQGMSQYNDALVRTVKAQGLEVLSLGAMDGRTDYFVDDCHFNEAGAREVASHLLRLFVADRADP